MHRWSILQHNFRASRRALLGFGLGLGALAYVSTLFFPAVRDSMADLQKMLEALPQGFLAVFGVSGELDLGSPTGYLQARLFDFLVPILLLVQAIGLGSAAIAGEEENGTLDLVLAHPISRSSVYWQKWLNMGLALAITGVCLLLATWLGSQQTQMNVGLGTLAGTVFLAVLLALFFGSLALAIGAWRGRRGLALAATGAIATLAYFANALLPLQASLKDWQVLSPFYHALGYGPLKEGLQAGHLLVLLALIAVVAVAGWQAFQKRDIAV